MKLEDSLSLEFDSSLKHLMKLIARSFIALGREVDPIFVEKIANIIYQVMSAKYRKYHNMDHVFNIVEDTDAIGVLAGIFHDTIYLQVDKRIHPLLKPYLQDISFDEKYQCVLPNLESERWLSLVGKVFQFETGQTKGPFSGLNEFLSALVMARMINTSISFWDMMQMIACIEATIPFREKPFEALRKTLVKLSSECNLKLHAKLLSIAMNRCVGLANQDVSGFFSGDFGLFTSQSWNLILENNPIFKNPMFTLQNYRTAIQKNELFLSTLDRKKIIHQFENFPDLSVFQQMKKQVEINMDAAVEYLRIKLVSIAILETLAEMSGGDAPFVLFLGEERAQARNRKAPIEAYLNNQINIPSDGKGKNLLVHETLKFGRSYSSGFDFQHAPLSTYLYEKMTADEIHYSIDITKKLYAGEVVREQFLSSLPIHILVPIMRAVGEVSWSRKDPLYEIERNLESFRKIAR